MIVPGARTVRPVSRVSGVVRVPGDKSISHRYVMLAALAGGRSVIRNLGPGTDVGATCACVEALGVSVSRTGGTVTIIGRRPGGFRSPESALDARNSGTTARLLAGILAAQPLTVTVAGDVSLSRRPMQRVITPLCRMGARIRSDGGCLPMTIVGGPLRGIDYEADVPSAQVKSAVLLAGLLADGVTRVTEPVPTRNHTELALGLFGAEVTAAAGTCSVLGHRALEPVDVAVPGDLSSAVFWCAAAAGLPGSAIEIPGVGLNPTRSAVLDVLRRSGALVETTPDDGGQAEPSGCLRVRHGTLRPITIGPAEVPALIDELPALAALATHGGEIVVTGATELRVKESDRISALVAGLRAMGAQAEESADGFRVAAPRPLGGGTADAAGDHRLAMAFAIAALGATGPSVIRGAGAVDVSYPGFFDVLDSIGS